MRSVVSAAFVHVFTASGIFCALLATLATLDAKYEQAFLWLGVAFLIDGLDGALARRYRVKDVLPLVSGETLDLVIDYVTYVFVPALMLIQADILPGAGGVVLAGLMCMSSLYHFSDEGSKADDHCFVGFPAIWNVVAFYLFAFPMPTSAVAAIVLACVVLTFVPFKWVHPVRVMSLRGVTLAATVAFGLAAADTIWRGFPATGLSAIALAAVLAYGIGLSLYFGRAR
jgi:phosphatidylcholine synthase